MAGVYGVLRTLQRQQRDSYNILLRLPGLLSSSSANPGRLLSIQQSKCSKPQLALFARKYSNEAQKPVSAKSEDKIEVDIGPGTWQEIYRGILATQIRMVKTFSLSTTMLGLMMQPIIVQKASETSFGIVVAMGSFIGFFTFVTPLLIHWITKKYVTRLEYDHEKDLYSATTLSFFLREKKIHFKVQDIHVPAVPGMFTTFLAKNKPLFVDPKMFSDLEHFGRIMGYDKPIDFKLGEKEGES
ncbi:transmembrane protein 70 homolog, mitochondrial-like [Penaeus japonicus]|uniref:transmembrane protein 70 homolog, mitochondrial-like n=1 Tax=Penaeus japonicus TaxID=27405 RepID=UPI001C717A0C|nr:transmembrane protein 70 homolog, mitochondrial-like [Penaeus japonicus]